MAIQQRPLILRWLEESTAAAAATAGGAGFGAKADAAVGAKAAAGAGAAAGMRDDMEAPGTSATYGWGMGLGGGAFPGGLQTVWLLLAPLLTSGSPGLIPDRHPVELQLPSSAVADEGVAGSWLEAAVALRLGGVAGGERPAPLVLAVAEEKEEEVCSIHTPGGFRHV